MIKWIIRINVSYCEYKQTERTIDSWIDDGGRWKGKCSSKLDLFVKIDALLWYVECILYYEILDEERRKKIYERLANNEIWWEKYNVYGQWNRSNPINILQG